MSKKTETAALTVAATEGTQKCQGACGETLSVRKFPTVHGKTGISRGTECRKDRDARYEAAKTARIAAGGRRSGHAGEGRPPCRCKGQEGRVTGIRPAPPAPRPATRQGGALCCAQGPPAQGAPPATRAPRARPPQGRTGPAQAPAPPARGDRPRPYRFPRSAPPRPPQGHPRPGPPARAPAQETLCGGNRTPTPPARGRRPAGAAPCGPPGGPYRARICPAPACHPPCRGRPCTGPPVPCQAQVRSAPPAPWSLLETHPPRPQGAAPPPKSDTPRSHPPPPPLPPAEAVARRTGFCGVGWLLTVHPCWSERHAARGWSLRGCLLLVMGAQLAGCDLVADLAVPRPPVLATSGQSVAPTSRVPTRKR